MIRPVLVFPLLLLLMQPICVFAAGNDEAPLTLLNKPQKSAQTAQNQAINSQNMQLHDIHGPVLIQEQPPYLLIAGIILLVLLMAALVFWFVKKRGKATPPPVPPWEKALQELADAKSLLKAERGLQYMDRVSQILRRYIESRFAIQSTRQTTREFLRSLTGISSNSPLHAHKSNCEAALNRRTWPNSRTIFLRLKI